MLIKYQQKTTTTIRRKKHTHCVRSPQPTYWDMDMEAHQNCGVCSVIGDSLVSPEKNPLKSAFYGL